MISYVVDSFAVFRHRYIFLLLLFVLDPCRRYSTFIAVDDEYDCRIYYGQYANTASGTYFFFIPSPFHVTATDVCAGLVVSTAADNDSVLLLLLLLPVPLSRRYYPSSCYFGVPVLLPP